MYPNKFWGSGETDTPFLAFFLVVPPNRQSVAKSVRLIPAIPRSSTAERPTVNRQVAGSNPAAGARKSPYKPTLNLGFVFTYSLYFPAVLGFPECFLFESEESKQFPGVHGLSGIVRPATKNGRKITSLTCGLKNTWDFRPWKLQKILPLGI